MLLIFHVVAATLLATPIFAGIEDEMIPGCDHFDTVNMTGSQRLVNGSYLYQGLLLPAELTADFDYRVLPDNTIEPVGRHLRGCVCKLRPCVRLCCHHSQLMANGQCSGSSDVELTRLNPYLNVTLDNGTVERRHFQTEFIIQSDLPLPCNDMYPINEEQDQYKVFENGSFFRSYDSVMLSKWEYCLQPYQFKEGETESYRIVPHNCAIKADGDIDIGIVVILLSEVCTVCTIVVYLWLKKLRNLHGKCFVCCLICMFTDDLFLLLDLCDLIEDICILKGYTSFYFMMATFLWLSVISWDLHCTFSSSVSALSRYTPKYVFLVCNVYAWGMAFIHTAVIYLVDHLVEDTEENEPWMPGVGFYNCWIKTTDWSAMLYGYGSILIVTTFNMTMFILTAIRIVAVKRELQVIDDRQGRKQKLNSDRKTYCLFLRLFIIMGLNRSVEILPYLVQDDDRWKNVNQVADYFKFSQGIIIFLLFVVKSSVLRLFRERNLSRNPRGIVAMKSHSSRHTNKGSTVKQPRDISSSTQI